MPRSDPKENTVLHSVNLSGDVICVDVFRRPDGTYGFEEFRRDPEDGRGWFAIGHHDHHIFTTEAQACQAACDTVGWLDGFDSP